MSQSVLWSLLIISQVLPYNNPLVINNETYHHLPKFWTNTGFCPYGNINHKDISESLLSDDVKTTLTLIGALPNGAISNVRIHWLLELVEFLKFQKHTIAEYDFSKLDELMELMQGLDLSVAFEIMGNPGGVFSKNVSNNQFLWEDLVFQIGKRYLDRFGPEKVQKWRFESWNEPDLNTYNILNLTTSEYLKYLKAIRLGLDAAARTPLNNIHLELRGPAGLFKALNRHPLCWSVVAKCNDNLEKCPFEILTFHKKGFGNSKEVIDGGKALLKSMFEKYPNLRSLRVANDEADPIAGWSTPRHFQSDVRYAVKLVMIILQHWSAKLNTREFKNLDSISHDNAFLSYHPYEFSQRTLFARFQMNLTQPKPYSQFIQKPVYVALGMLGNLGQFAKDIDIIEIDEKQFTILKTSGQPDGPLYLSWVIASTFTNHSRTRLPITIKWYKSETIAIIIETLEFKSTDPARVWKSYGSPSYPNSTLRLIMRRSQGPQILTNKIIKHTYIKENFQIRSPSLVFVRLCSREIQIPPRPYDLKVNKVTTGEVLISWKEVHQPLRCIKTYEVYFMNNLNWENVANNWHISFLSFHFQPGDGKIYGAYKVRPVDVFGRFGNFSDTLLYY